MSFYDLVMKDYSGKEIILKYNPHTSELYMPDGTSAVNHEEKEWGIANIVSPETPGKKSAAPRTLKIQLGLKCNYACSYCSQASHVGSAINTKFTDAKIFIKTLDKWLEGEPTQIEFWGGEPLLYWNKIKYLVEELSVRYPNSKYLIITNGSLIDQEFIDYVVKYNIGVAISHDGPGQHLRGPDPFDDPEKMKWIQKFTEARKGKMSFNAVITPENYNLEELLEFFKARFGGDVRVGFEGVVTSYNDDPEKCYVFTPDQYSQLTENIANLIFKHRNEDQMQSLPGTFLNKIIDFSETLKFRRPSSAVGQKCGMDREDSLAVDLLGNVMTCQNTTSADTNHRIGHVMLMDKVALDTSWHWSHREECSHCPVLQLCKGSCMYLPNDFNWFYSCNNEYYYNLGILAGALYLITDGWILKEVRGMIARPDPALLDIKIPIVQDRK